MRAFFAINTKKNFEPFWGDIKSKLCHMFKDHNYRLSNLEDLHITLNFLPQLEKNLLPTLLEKVSVELNELSSFFLEVGNLNLFYQAPLKIIYVEIKFSKHLEQLVTKIENILFDLGCNRDKLHFKPHITLVKLKAKEFKKTDLDNLTLPKIPDLYVSEIFLFESRPNHLGSHYTPLAKINLFPVGNKDPF